METQGFILSWDNLLKDGLPVCFDEPIEIKAHGWCCLVCQFFVLEASFGPPVNVDQKACYVALVKSLHDCGLRLLEVVGSDYYTRVFSYVCRLKMCIESVVS